VAFLSANKFQTGYGGIGGPYGLVCSRGTPATNAVLKHFESLRNFPAQSAFATCQDRRILARTEFGVSGVKPLPVCLPQAFPGPGS
jgi:hypothetical protein